MLLLKFYNFLLRLELPIIRCSICPLYNLSTENVLMQNLEMKLVKEREKNDLYCKSDDMQYY